MSLLDTSEKTMKPCANEDFGQYFLNTLYSVHKYIKQYTLTYRSIKTIYLDKLERNVGRDLEAEGQLVPVPGVDLGANRREHLQHSVLDIPTQAGIY